MKPFPNVARKRVAVLFVLAHPMPVTAGRVGEADEQPAAVQYVSKGEMLRNVGCHFSERYDERAGNTVHPRGKNVSATLRRT